MRRPVAVYGGVALAMALALVLLVLGTAPPAVNDDPSSRAAGRGGTLALYRWLGNLGFGVHRVGSAFDLTGTDVLLVIDPRTRVSTADAAALARLVRSGADAVVALSPESVADVGPLLDALDVGVVDGRPAGTSVPAQPFDASDRVHDVAMAAGLAIEPSAALTPLLVQGGAITAAAESIGAGRAYVLASPQPLTNDGLRHGDSAGLVLALLERARGGAIAFDEYHHGEADLPAGGAAAIFASPLGLALGLATLAVLVYLVLHGRRLGPPLPAGDPAAVPSTAAYVEAMAGLFGRSRDRGVVADRYAAELRGRVGAGAVAAPGPEGDVAFVAALGRSRPDLAEDAAVVLTRARALAAQSPDAPSLLALAIDIDRLEARWAQPPAAAGQSPE